MDITKIIVLLIGLSIVCEYIVQLVKDISESIQTKNYWTVTVKLLAIVIGVLISFVVNYEIFPLLNTKPVNAPATIVIIGVCISAGSGLFFDLIKRLKGVSQ